MPIFRKYILDNFTLSFFSIFFPLFAIASVIFLIKLATYTAIIQLTLWEMVKLYIFVLPEILFFTLPITFFIAATLTLFKFSNDNEMIVFFSLGIHPNSILKTLLVPSIILTLLLLVNFLFIFPHAKILSKNFISFKKSEAKFNLSASEFGHSFGDWLLYIGKENKNNTYGDVILFNKNKEEEILIGAKTAKMINENGLLRLKLTHGEGYSYSKEKFTQINFTTMFINDSMSSNLIEYKTPIEYWLSETNKRLQKKKKKMFITNILLSFLPIFSLFLVASISIVHIRHQKARVYLYLFIGIAVYYLSAASFQKQLGFYAIGAVAIPWLVVTYLIYKKQIVAKF
ncbi:MAG: LptF/LptG family permease [Campylobacterota bacterium]|nr:LptF/LptG family permease [Campylobacterota bacterium]